MLQSQLVSMLVGVLFLLGCQEEIAVSSEEIVGVWITSTDSFIEDGIGYREVLLDHFREDGSFITHTSSEMYLSKSGIPFVSLEGPEKGRWQLKGNQIEKIYESSEVKRFKSSKPEITRIQFEALFAKKIQTPEVLSVKMVREDSIVVEDTVTNVLYTMIRHDPSSSVSTIPR